MHRIMSFLKTKKIVLLTIMLISILSIALQNIDPDVYWHIKTGEWVVNNGIPIKDPFSYWDTGFIAQEWLFDIFAYIIYGFLGFHGIVIIPAILFGLTIYICSTASETKSYWPILLIFLMFAKNPAITMLRPHVSSFLIFGIVMTLLNKNKCLWLIPILTLICVNLHGGVSVVIFIVYLVNLLAYFYDNYKNYNKKNVLYKLLILVLTATALFCNPNGAKIITYGLYTPPLSMESLPIITSSKDLITLFMLLLPAACMAFTKKRNLNDILMVFMSIMATLLWRRMMGFYILVFIIHGMPYVAETIELIWNKLFHKNNRHEKIKPIINTTVLYLTIASIIFAAYAAVVLPKDNLDSVPDITAKPVLEYIKENNLDVKNNIMLNHYNLGGYFIFNDIPVFVDSRCEPYLKEFGNEPVMDDYFSMINFDNNAIELLKKYNVKYIVAYDYSALVKGLQEMNAVNTLVDEAGVVLLEINNLGGVEQ